MVSTGIQPDPRKFLHQCQHCTRKYRVTIRVDIQTVHRANCPHCGKTNYFDNKAGQIRRMVDADPGGARPAFFSGSGAGRSSYTPPPGEPTLPGSSPGGKSNGKQSSRGGGTKANSTRGKGKSGERQIDPPVQFPAGRTDPGAPARNWEGAAEQNKSRGKKSVSGIGAPAPWSRGSGGREGNGPGGGFAGAFSGRSMGPGSRRDILRDRGPGLVREIVSRIDWRLAAVIVVGLGLLVGAGGLATLRMASFWIPGGMEQYTQRLATIRPNRVLDRDGTLLAELFSRRTGALKSDEIPDSLKAKLIFVEDQNFFTHGGLDYYSLFRATLQNIMAMRYVQGGSTLTQQLSRILLGDRSRVLARKIREANLAYYLEDHYSKDQILTAYMNHVYLGHGSVGMDVASRFYFGRGLDDINFVQELMLVCLPSAPERNSPLKNPARLQNKMDAVYLRMRREGFSDLPVESYNNMKAAVFQNLNRSPNSNVFSNRVDHAPFVTEYVRLKIRQLLGAEFEFGAGITVETTISRNIQNTVARETAAYLTRVGSRFTAIRYADGKRVRNRDLGQKIARSYHRAGLGAMLLGFPAADISDNVLQSASVGIRPETGEVIFLQGGRRFSSANQYNRALRMYRQTGSAIKPIIYSAGIESGQITPGTLVDDSPIYVPLSKTTASGKGYWLPQNISGKYEGPISVRRAFARSKNIPAIRVARIVGLPRLSEQFRKFFFHDEASFKKRFRWDQTISIGSLEMSPLEMAAAFAAFGDDGRMRRPYIIKRILDREGKEVYNAKGKDEFRLGIPENHQALAPDAAQIMSTMLSESARFGGVHRGGLKSKYLLGKTGTSNDYRDAWFVGLVPGVAAAVWVGYDDPRYSMKGGTGSAVAGPLWGRLISKVGKQLPKRKEKGWQFSKHGVRASVCAHSQKLPGPYCPVVTEWHRKDHVPNVTCPLEHFDPNAYDQDWSVNSDSDFN